MKRAPFVVAFLAAAIAGTTAYVALQAHASTSAASAPRVAHSGSAHGESRFRTGSSLSPGVQELARNDGLAMAALHELAGVSGARPAEIFGAAKGDATCAYLTGGSGAVGGCMRLGTELVMPRLAIVDGGTYVWGLAADQVTGVQVRSAGQTFNGSVGAGAFSIEIPDGSHGTSPIDLIVATGSSATTIPLPGVPKPLP